MPEPGKHEAKFVAAAVGASFVTACSLMLPWFTIAGRGRSSIDLIASAGALDIIDGGTRVVVVALWLFVPILGAAALVLAAAQRVKLAAGLAAVVGFAVLATVAVGFGVEAIMLAWGAGIAALSGLVALGCSMMVFLGSKGTR